MAYALQPVLDALNSMREEWASLCSNPLMKDGFDREKEWVIKACEKNEYATKTALANVDAVMSALRDCASVGITLDPAQKLAYVLPRDNKMVYDVSYMGLLDTAIRSGALAWGQARVVHGSDTFVLDGYDRPPVHKYKPFAKDDERGPVVGAYVVVKTTGGDYLTNAMAADDINAIRDRSPAWKQRKPDKPNSGGPWATDWDEMAKKTCVKNGYKYWPRSPAMDRAIDYLNTEGGQGIDLTPEDASKTLVAIWTAKINAATTGEAAQAAWLAAREACKEANDTEARDALREVALAKAAALNPTGAPASSPAPSPAPTAAPTPAPTQAPAATPAPTTAPPAGRRMSLAGKTFVLDKINKTETDDELEKTGPLIDALPEADRPECDDAYNARIAYLDKKFNRKPAA